MLRAFSSAVSGLRTQMAFMDVVANNIANVSTAGFKAQRARFSDMLYQTLNGGAAETTEQGSINPSQIGLGVRLAGVDAVMTQGALRATSPLDVAIEGEGFFALKDSGASAILYTRDGASASADRAVDQPQQRHAGPGRGRRRYRSTRRCTPRSASPPTARSSACWRTGPGRRRSARSASRPSPTRRLAARR
ncbi:MAG: flagellar hook-basal body complex protein [Dehalococcoidia bacterium]